MRTTEWLQKKKPPRLHRKQSKANHVERAQAGRYLFNHRQGDVQVWREVPWLVYERAFCYRHVVA